MCETPEAVEFLLTEYSALAFDAVDNSKSFDSEKIL